MFDLANRLRLILAALILVPVLLYWGISDSPQESVSRAPLTDQMDYFIDQGKLREWQSEGQLQRQLSTIRLEHYPAEQASHLQQPKTLSYREDGSRVRVTANKGVSLDDNSRTDLAGDVRVHDNPDTPTATILKTEQLAIFHQLDRAETDLPVTIESANSILQGVGMDVEFNSRVMNLHSQVEGTHNNAN
ncbi:LPS export ABC transporter periplasmic protein LptC [Neptuniibacter halophilus]|uniref:LPS export ABC transporter periplasmic protein LptC n=1 Tax=Neptuniibacter halophilus TaxID=651666 RepID=UPI00257460A3|nr:LPS export ABC transporter periplasmic protein LptC [Neptuniibacter halophilus]